MNEEQKKAWNEAIEEAARLADKGASWADQFYMATCGDPEGKQADKDFWHGMATACLKMVDQIRALRKD